MNNSQRVLSSLKVSGNLPSMPQVLVQLLDCCHNPEVPLQEISRIVDKDAAISAKVLQLVNSAFIGSRKAIASIEQAVIHLGMDTVRNLAIAISVQQVFRRVETNGLLSIDRFWHHSYTNALLARNLAEAIGYANPSEAYLAGLLHDIGKLLLWMAFPGSYAPLLLKGVRCHNARLAFLEEEKLQVNHCQAGAWLCEQWQLPTLIADAIRFHHHPLEELCQALPLTRIVAFADLLSHNQPDTPECVEAAAQLFGLKVAQVAALSTGIDEQIDQLAGELGIHLPRLAKTSHDKEPENEESHRETSRGLISRIRDISQLSGLLDNLLRVESGEQIIAAVEQSLKILFNEERCLVLLPDTASGRLCAQASPHNPLIRETQGFSFKSQDYPGSLPARALRQGHLLHSFGDKAGKQGPQQLFDTQLLHLLGCDGMAVLPLTCHGQNEGLLVIGLMKRSFRSLSGQASALQLVAGHAAVALHLLRSRAQQAQRITEERLQAAHLVARKIGHEINNPLAIIRNYLHILERKAASGQTISEEISIIDGEMERLAHLTHNLDSLSLAATDPQPQQLDLHRELELILLPYQASLGGQGQRSLTLVAQGDTPTLVRLDPAPLRQIIHNLVKNSLEAIGPQGSIIVRYEQGEGTLRIDVEDNGPGIDAAALATIFTPGTSTKTGDHRGLGLSIAASLAEQMQGNLSCLPQPGKTIFTLSLPA